LAVVDFGFISMSRAGLLTAAAAVATVFILWPARHLLSFIAVLTVVVSLLAILNPNFSVGGYSRQIGPDQVIQNVGSIVGIGGDESLRGTKEWRQQWWDKVWDYTVNGPHFLAGKGFGVNLADDDGFQLFADDSLRSPHNGHVTILARMGVPGLALWLAMQAWFGWSIFTAFLRAKGSGATFWAQVDSWIFVYWMAMLLNMSFDVYLEGPQGGIWFWTVFGVGLAALRLQSQAGVGLEAPRAQG
jgi:O-antigen ligase